MEKVSIDTLNENESFHFTETKYLEKIQEEGLIASIGENAIGIERTPKIFFSKGEMGVIKLSEVWLRWLMNRIYGPNDRLNQYKNLTAYENNKRVSEWVDEFLSHEYLNDQLKKEQLFEYFYYYLKERSYLVLDIKDGIEYDSNDLDENKVEMNRRPDSINKMFAKIMYGEFSNIDTNNMEDWNMHTKTNINIDKSKIRQVITPDGKEDMLSIIIYLYDKYKNIPHNQMLLDDFVDYAKLKDNDYIQKEGKEYAKNNNSRIY
ncbi:MAG: hypothetical protein E7160_02640 [Firmicutes bacterium]|nr:hypothetical protein [Bacillota bacterium]